MIAADAPLPAIVVAPTAGTHDHGPAHDHDVPIVLVHGFTQSSASWGAIVEDLAGIGRPIIAVDLPGHGVTDPDLDGSDLSESAALLGATTGRAVYVGYSMGGRTALRLALDRPDLVEALVLIGATAGIDGSEARAARRAADGARADHLESVGTEAFLDEWLEGSLFSGLTPTEADLDGRRANRPAGLAASLRHAGTGTMEPPWWDDVGALSMPVLLVTGEHDQKFAELADRLAGSIGPNATRATIAGAGHPAHLEQPAGTARAIAEFLAATPDRG